MKMTLKWGLANARASDAAASCATVKNENMRYARFADFASSRSRPVAQRDQGAAAAHYPVRQSDQYRATMMIAATMSAATSERARSKFFDLGCASSGGMTLGRLCHRTVPHSGRRWNSLTHRFPACCSILLSFAKLANRRRPIFWWAAWLDRKMPRNARGNFALTLRG
jgi:hypothetical protein